MTYDVYISYSRKDTAIADCICAAFDRAGISYFIDRQGTDNGRGFSKIAIMESEVFLLLASENAFQSPFTSHEILYAFNEKRGKKMLLYSIDGSKLPDSTDILFSCFHIDHIMEECSPDPVLIDEVQCMLGRPFQTCPPSLRYTQEELKIMDSNGFKYYLEEQYEEAVKMFRIAAEQGYASAQRHLGSMYVNGYGVPQDYDEAWRWYQKAISQGDVAAMNGLGCMYQYGYGVPIDRCEAERWYRKAAEQGNTNGMCLLGQIFENDWDYSEAVRWYRKAAEQGDADAQYNLALKFKNGQGVNKDLSEARRWFQKAADQGDEDAKEQLQKL